MLDRCREGFEAVRASNLRRAHAAADEMMWLIDAALAHPGPPKEAATITQQEVREALARGAKEARDVAKHIAPTFTPQGALAEPAPKEAADPYRVPKGPGWNERVIGAIPDDESAPAWEPAPTAPILVELAGARDLDWHLESDELEPAPKEQGASDDSMCERCGTLLRWCPHGEEET
jgi:hypothetical protein